uniref:Secreted protein n=1 Tax=Macrostomum lignano TaxID=282301 RepID=A0A1I8FDT4_9PLAT
MGCALCCSCLSCAWLSCSRLGRPLRLCPASCQPPWPRNGGAPGDVGARRHGGVGPRCPPAYPGWAAASWKVNVPSPPTYEEALAGPALERPSLISFCPNLPLFLCRASPSVIAESPAMAVPVRA